MHFQGNLETICLTNLWLRTADRVLIRVATFPAADFDALFETTRRIEWGKLIPHDASFPVTGRSLKSTLTSVPACQRSVKRAIVDALLRDHAKQELPETGAEFKVDVALLKDHATLTIKGLLPRVSKIVAREAATLCTNRIALVVIGEDSVFVHATVSICVCIDACSPALGIEAPNAGPFRDPIGIGFLGAVRLHDTGS